MLERLGFLFFNVRHDKVNDFARKSESDAEHTQTAEDEIKRERLRKPKDQQRKERNAKSRRHHHNSESVDDNISQSHQISHHSFVINLHALGLCKASA